MGRIIGITGTIGSGKSTVANIMRSLGAYVVDADILARYVLLPDSRAIPEIREAFGDDVMLHGCIVNRRALAQTVFSDPQALEKLNAITHPYIKNAMKAEADTAFRVYHHSIVVYDAPLLIEAGLCEELSDIWLVTCSLETKIERIIKRDHTTRSLALQRINARKSDAEMKKLATVVIENDGSYESLVESVTQIYKERYFKG